ncbi:MAG: glycoside hydrolase family 10 protein [Pirellulales bacterium]
MIVSRKLLTAITLLAALAQIAGEQAAAEPPPVQREFRGAWIATVANIDWPSKPGLSVEKQQEELIKLMDLAVELNLNAIVLHVRPACDAFYKSSLEPWSPFLTGKMGQAPEPEYDPLEFAVEEAHRRGLELHAWFNPYRATAPTMQGEVSANHVSRTHPEWVREYGEYRWLDPGEPGAVEYNLAAILDVVRRYDIDAVHFDDYFYPYPISDKEGKPIDFPDDASWQKYLAGLDGKEPLKRDDWRRANVDDFLKRLSDAIHAEKPWVRFGVSPFGIYRPGHPESIKGFDAYDKLYADSLQWFQDGTVDYFSPQLYWPIAQKAQSYPVLLKWWAEQNRAGRNLWPGNFTSRIDDGAKDEWSADELVHQIEATRAQAGATGNVHFSIKALAADRGGVATKLKQGVYSAPALVPASPWLATKTPPPAAPQLAWKSADAEGPLLLRSPSGEAPWLWVVREKAENGWTTQIVPGHTQELGGLGKNKVVVTAVNRIGVEGPAATLDPPAGG